MPPRKTTVSPRKTRMSPIREVPVTISVVKGKITGITPDPFLIHKHGDQDIRWICKPPQRFMVDFGNDSPFYQNQFSNNYPCSGLVKRELVPNPNKIYKYTVRIDRDSVDPTGGVDK